MNKRIATIIKLLQEFDEKELPIQLIDTNLGYLYQDLMMILMLERECEENEN